MPHPETLVKFIQIKKPLLWVGAGLSIDAGYPTVGLLAHKLWEEHAYGPKPPESNPYGLVNAFYQEYGRGDLDEALSKIIPAGVESRPSHKALARIAKSGFFSGVITTNYDRLLDNAFSEKSVDYLPQVIDGNQHIRTGNRLRLYKIHGDVADWKNVILTADSYAKFNERYGFLRSQFDILLTQNPVLFIGCSMLDERILDWLDKLPPEEAKLINSWMAILTASQLEAVKQYEHASGLSAWEILNKISFRVLDLPDFKSLPKWLDEIADKVAPPGTGRRELILNIRTSDTSSPEQWRVDLDGRNISNPSLPVHDKAFIEKLEQLEKMVHLPLPCDVNGILGSGENTIETAIHEHAAAIGAGLSEILDDQGRKTILKSMNHNIIPLLRIIVDGDLADRVLALPWELLRLNDCFPVKEGQLDIVREIKVDGAPGLATAPDAFRVLVHIAAPEDEEGQGALMYEEEAYRLILSMQRAVKGAVAFSDLGTVRDLIQALNRINPTVVHFTGHGKPGALLFEDEDGGKINIHISTLLAELRAGAAVGQPTLPPVFYLASCHGASGTAVSGQASPGYRQLSELGAVKGEGPSTAATLQREGCPAIVGYFGPVGDQLSTRAEVVFYSALAAGKRLTESVRQARNEMTRVLSGKGSHYRYPLGWAQLALYLRGGDVPITEEGEYTDNIYALEQELCGTDSPVHGLEVLHSGPEGFIGRRRDLAMLRQRHIKGRRIFVLHGLGGIGKTALAVNLIPKLGIKPESIILLDAARADQADDPVQDLWEQLSLQVQQAFPGLLETVLEKRKKTQDPLSLLGAVLHTVKKPWLIYLDNAESLQVKVESEEGELGTWGSPGIARWWAMASKEAVHGGTLTLMATTRYFFPGLDRKHGWQVGVLRSADIARMMRWFQFLRKIPHDHIDQVVQWLNGHARALVYLEGLLNEIFDPLTPDDEITGDQWKAAIKEALPGTEARLINEDLMLSHIWKRLDSKARKHLQALTSLRRPVPPDAVKILGDQTRRLENLGLITKFPGELRGMHPTVHRFVEEHEGEARTDDHLRIGRWYLATYESNNDPALAEETVYHLLTAKEVDLAASPADALARYYWRALRYADARRVLDSILDLGPTGELHEELLITSGNLHVDLGHYGLAASDFQAVIDSSHKRHPSGKSEASGLHGLANALSRLGRYEDAVEAYYKSLEIKKQAYGTEAHPEYAASLHGLANALSRLGRYEDAVEAYYKSLEIKKQAYGTEAHPEYAASLHGLANALYSLGRYEEAVEAYYKSLEIKKQAYGTEAHPEYAASLHGLANALSRLGRYEDAVEAYYKSLEIKKQAYGTEAHPEYAASLHGLANALYSLGRYEEAVEAYYKSLEIKKQAYGTEAHPEYAASLHGLANALYSLGRYEEAVEAYYKSLEIDKQAYGTEAHPESLPTLTNLGVLLAEIGRIDRACRKMERALSIARNLGQPYYLGHILFRYAQVEATRNTQKALGMARESEALLLQVFEPSHPTVQGVKEFLRKLEKGTDQGQDRFQEGITTENLIEWTHGLLRGIYSVSNNVFIHLVQRIVLLMSDYHQLTQLAVMMGRPGLELEDTPSLKLPGKVPPEKAKELKQLLKNIKELINQVGQDVGEKIETATGEDGRIAVLEITSGSVPEGLAAVLLDEATAIIMAGSEELLRAELDLVLKGLSIQIKETDDPAAMDLTSLLLEKLPDDRDTIVGLLAPLCSDEQLQVMAKTER